MICYHGLPVGGGRDQAELPTFLRGRHAMVSFAEPSQLSVALDYADSVVLDNGAFSMWKASGGKTYDAATFEQYVGWVASLMNEPALAWAVIPDVIGGREEENDALIEAWPLTRHIGVPVWHLHEPIDRLVRLVEAWPRVALGSSGEYPTPGEPQWWRRISEALDAVCDDAGRPRARLHGLRMLAEEIVNRVPLSSADSTDCAQNARNLHRFGTYVPPTNIQRATAIAQRIEARVPARSWNRELVPCSALSLFPAG